MRPVGLAIAPGDGGCRTDDAGFPTGRRSAGTTVRRLAFVLLVTLGAGCGKPETALPAQSLQDCASPAPNGWTRTVGPSGTWIISVPPGWILQHLYDYGDTASYRLAPPTESSEEQTGVLFDVQAASGTLLEQFPSFVDASSSAVGGKTIYTRRSPDTGEDLQVLRVGHWSVRFRDNLSPSAGVDSLSLMATFGEACP